MSFGSQRRWESGGRYWRIQRYLRDMRCKSNRRGGWELGASVGCVYLGKCIHNNPCGVVSSCMYYPRTVFCTLGLPRCLLWSNNDKSSLSFKPHIAITRNITCIHTINHLRFVQWNTTRQYIEVGRTRLNISATSGLCLVVAGHTPDMQSVSDLPGGIASISAELGFAECIHPGIWPEGG